MQLKRIQLNGFKSFVDPTTIPILSHVNAIVGPNGCGKSNIVDAIRWVTGEMSAKQLRGQSMSDVIFNGSTSRKPAGKASVELIFDNADHRIGGEYGAFTEISIRREVVRDGQSNYFINGVPARRRDLVDLFLGTGLGPRSYAIIEQGMISQLVEAKPEDMRTHLEEVAGISKYRERRRETETRIRHTQENCDRLNDVRDELEKQLRHLERQSEAAEKYKILQAELRLLHAQMKALQWQQFENQLHDKKQAITQSELECESQTASLRECEKNIEKTRVESQSAVDEKELVQKQFYEITSDIARLEQQIAYKEEQLKQWEMELKQSAVAKQELKEQTGSHDSEVGVLTNEVEKLKPQADELQTQLHEANSVLAEAEQNMRAFSQNWDQFQQDSAKTNQQLEVTKNTIRHHESQKKQLTDRRDQLQLQLNNLSLGDLSNELSPLSLQSDELKKQVVDVQAALSQLSQDITAHRQAYQEAQAAHAKAQGDLQKQEAQYASLSALQNAALQNHEDIKPWLLEHQLNHAAQLGKSIQVAAGWETAVETILKNYFHAVCVPSIEIISDSLSGIQKGELTLLEKTDLSKARLSRKTLADVIEGAHLPSWLSSIYIAEDVSEALSFQKELSDAESIITQHGEWIGRNWISISRAHAAEENFLVREKQLKELASLIESHKNTLTELAQKQAQAKTTLEELEKNRDATQRLFQEKSAELTALQTKLSAKQSRLEALTQEQKRLQADFEQCESQIAQCAGTLHSANEMIESYLSAQSTDQEKRQSLLSQRAEIEKALQDARAQAQFKKQQADERHIRLSSSEKQLALLTQTVRSNQKQLTQLNERCETLTQQIDESRAPLFESKKILQDKLSEHASVDQNLRQADTKLQSAQNLLRELEKTRDRLSHDLSALQEAQQQSKLAISEMLVRQTTLQEQLTEMQFDLQSVIAELPENAVLIEWEERARVCQNKIDRLGPINLAAIDEFKTLSERKTYMDAQVTDLLEALNVLQDAIRKIDRETKHLFKDTFDTVNTHFQKLFPRIFGGGQASLELTEEDLLTTGVIVRAQPPGKRNATIHMLSGGEKTLTAISLMFAIFQLNPAPFCMLDEVDAPLDDLNVGRYCQLVKEMSADTQFLVISHNKVTIEMADYLMGVTMQEPGVSRIVSVDMQAAVEMAQA